MKYETEQKKKKFSYSLKHFATVQDQKLTKLDRVNRL